MLQRRVLWVRRRGHGIVRQAPHSRPAHLVAGMAESG